MKLQGLIDLHTHGFGRYDTKTADPQDILRIADLHGRAGTAAILPAIYPGTIEEMRRNMEAVRKAMDMQRSEVGKRQSPPLPPRGKARRKEGTQTSSRILGVHLEGPFLNPLRCGALNGGLFLRPTLSSLDRLTEGYEDLIKIITIAPELPGALRIVERCAELGLVVSMGHSEATYRQAMNGKAAGAKGVTHLFNAMRPFQHREPGLVGFGLLDADTYVEVIADGYHLSPETLRLVFSLKGAHRIILVSDSVRGASGHGLPVYGTGKVLAGSGTTVARSVGLLVGLGLPLKRVVETARANPRRLLTKK